VENHGIDLNDQPDEYVEDLMLDLGLSTEEVAA
jgi:hypothetical protein